MTSRPLSLPSYLPRPTTLNVPHTNHYPHSSSHSLSISPIKSHPSQPIYEYKSCSAPVPAAPPPLTIPSPLDEVSFLAVPLEPDGLPLSRVGLPISSPSPDSQTKSVELTATPLTSPFVTDRTRRHQQSQHDLARCEAREARAASHVRSGFPSLRFCFARTTRGLPVIGSLSQGCQPAEGATLDQAAKDVPSRRTVQEQND